MADEKKQRKQQRTGEVLCAATHDDCDKKPKGRCKLPDGHPEWVMHQDQYGHTWL